MSINLGQALVPTFGMNSLIDLAQPEQVAQAIADLTRRIDELEKRCGRVIKCGLVAIWVGLLAITPAAALSNESFPVNGKRVLIAVPIVLGCVLLIAGHCIHLHVGKIKVTQRAVAAYENNPAFREALHRKHIQVISLKNLRHEYLCQ